MKKILIPLLLLFAQFALGQATNFYGSATPVEVANTTAYGNTNLGFRFKVNTAGTLTGLRFWKSASSNGRYIGSLFNDTTAGAVPIDSISFAGVTSSGWQSANFRSPITLTANHIYVLSVFFPTADFFGDANFTVPGSVTNADGTITAIKLSGGIVFGAYTNPYVGSDNEWFIDPLFSPTNTPPVANAGPNISLITPASTATLTGSGTDADGTIASYAWTKVSEPAGATSVITSASSATTGLTALSQLGTYTYRLTVTDNSGGTNSATVTVTVNSSLTYDFFNNVAPIQVANTTPYGNTNLGLRFRPLVDGYITAIKYNKASGSAGPHIASLFGDTLAGNIPFDSISFTGETTSGWQTVYLRTPRLVTTGNTYVAAIYFPAANFYGDGPYTTSASANNPAGNLQAIKQSGGIVFGAYTNPYVGSDNLWLIDVIFSPLTQSIPIARAGADINIYSPTTTTSLDGTTSQAPSGKTITAYAWTKISGPTGGTITSPASATTGITSLINGTYTFRLTVTDNTGVTATDDVLVISSNTVTTTINYTGIAATTYIPNGGLVEDWHGQGADVPAQGINIISESVQGKMYDRYERSYFKWYTMETSQNVYNWTTFDDRMNTCITNNQRLSFALMALAPGDGNNVAGSFCGYPTYLHTLMQAETVKDFVSQVNNTWIPNYNSANWQARQSAWLNALAAHINSTTFNGKSYKDAVGVVTIGIMGCWGEWNWSNAINNVTTFNPTGTIVTYAAGKAVIDAYIAAFPNNPLVILHAAFDHQTLPNVWTDPQIGYYAYTVSNAWGKLGIARDNWGAPDQFMKDWDEQSTYVWAGILRFDTSYQNRWKYAPLVGEGLAFNEATYSSPFTYWPGQVRLAHTTGLANGNFNGEQNLSVRGRDSLRAAYAALGYKIKIISSVMPSALNSNLPCALQLQWQNIGQCPPYYSWEPHIRLRNTATNAVALDVISTLSSLKLFQPGSAVTITDNLVLSGVAAGTYNIELVVFDKVRYWPPMALYITTPQNADGSYTLRSNVTVSNAAASNQLPVSVPGANVFIASPVTTTTLNGSGTDADGTIASYAWSQVLGPNTATIVSPATASTSVTGLIVGVYVFNLQVTDNSGGVANATLTVQVSANLGSQSGRFLKVKSKYY